LLVLTAALTACGSASSSTPAPAEPAPAEAPAPPAAAPTADDVLIAGTIAAPADAPEAQAVFVSLRVPGRRGPPLAAKRLPAGPFPLSFTLTEADRPMANGPVPEAFEVKVTLDVDGDPMAKSPTDLEAIAPGAKGAKDLALTLAPRR
jgi:hypothetical protein